ncbi:MAG: YciI family protein, partial [Alphaproteobacteria bacterium]|nr:YciI family protein [Alphaproteobacteria bacterium]
GSLYIVNVPDRKAAEAFSKNDPFTSAGVFGSVTITAMRKSHWNPGSA